MEFLNSHDIVNFCRASHPQEDGHPILQNLNNPIFNRILTCTDQAVLVFNYSTFTFEYVSESIVNITGVLHGNFLSGGNDVLAGLIHPDDLHYMDTVVYPGYLPCLEAVPPSRWKDLKFCHTSRIRKTNGAYSQVLHQSVPLSFDAGKMLLGLMTLADISNYKKGNAVAYKNVLIDGDGLPLVLSEGLSRDSIFSKREGEILSLTARGFSEKQIAAELFLSPNTVKTHRRNMFKKAGVTNAPALIRFGFANLII